MSRFIQLNDVNGTPRFTNIKHIAYTEPSGENCKVVMTIPGRDEYKTFAFLTTQTFETVMRLILDSDE